MHAGSRSYLRSSVLGGKIQLVPEILAVLSPQLQSQQKYSENRRNFNSNLLDRGYHLLDEGLRKCTPLQHAWTCNFLHFYHVEFLPSWRHIAQALPKLWNLWELIIRWVCSRWEIPKDLLGWEPSHIFGWRKPSHKKESHRLSYGFLWNCRFWRRHRGRSVNERWADWWTGNRWAGFEDF